MSREDIDPRTSNNSPSLNIAHLKTLTLEENLEETLKHLNFNGLKETDQRALFGLLKGRPFRHLYLKGAQALQDTVIQQGLNLVYLLTLNLKGCLSLSDRVIPLIAHNAPSLESLNLSHIVASMREIGRERTGPFNPNPLYVLFPSLRYLNMSASGIQTLLIEAPLLEVLQAKEAKDLQVLEVRKEGGSSPLRKADLGETQGLSLQIFLKFLEDHPSLEEMQTEGAQNLPHVTFPIGEELRGLMDLYKRATESKDPEAQYQMGEIYAAGKLLKQNPDKALEWLQAAVQNKHDCARVVGLTLPQKDKDTLDFSEKSLTAQEMKYLVVLLQGRALKSLILNFNTIGAEGAETLPVLTPLRKLDLYGANIGNAGVRVISLLTNLTSLDVGLNNIEAPGAQDLCSLITLTTLNMRNNTIGDQGSEYLSLLTRLTDLDVQNNKIGGKGIQALCSLPNLTRFNVGWNLMGPEGKQALEALKKKNPQIRIISNE